MVNDAKETYNLGCKFDWVPISMFKLCENSRLNPNKGVILQITSIGIVSKTFFDFEFPAFQGYRACVVQYMEPHLLPKDKNFYEFHRPSEVIPEILACEAKHLNIKSKSYLTVVK